MYKSQNNDLKKRLYRRIVEGGCFRRGINRIYTEFRDECIVKQES